MRLLSFPGIISNEVWLAAILAVTLFSPALSLFLLAAFYLFNLSVLSLAPASSDRILMRRGLLVSAALILLVYVNGVLQPGADAWFNLEDNRYYFAALLLFFFVHDFFHSLTSVHPVRYPALANYVLIFLSASILLLMAERFFFGVPLDGVAGLVDLFSETRSRLGRFLPLNPNHQDDLFLFFATLAGWAFFLQPHKGSAIRVVIGIVIFLFVFLFLDLFLKTQSRAGFVGLVAALGAVNLLLLYRRRFRAVLWINSVAVLAMAVNLHLISDRFTGPLSGQPAPQTQALLVQQNKAATQPALNVGPSVQIARLGAQYSDTGIGWPLFLAAATNGSVECGQWGRGPSGGQVSGDHAIALRLTVYRAAFGLWLQKPLLGYGSYDKDRLSQGMEPEAYCAMQYVSHPHNQYLDMLIRGGVVLLAVYLFTVGFVALGLLRTVMRRDGRHVVPAALILGFLVYHCVENLFDLGFARNDYLLAAILSIWAMAAITTPEAVEQQPAPDTQPAAGKEGITTCRKSSVFAVVIGGVTLTLVLPIWAIQQINGMQDRFVPHPVPQETETVFLADFRDGIEPFAPLASEMASRTVLDTSQGILETEGRVILIGREFLEIDPEETYLMTVEYQLPEGSIPQQNTLHAGFATFSQDKTLETEQPGTHRYFASRGPITNRATDAGDGWMSVSGTIHGTGKRVNAFRQTSVFAKPVILVNFSMPEGSMKLRRVRVARVK